MARHVDVWPIGVLGQKRWYKGVMAQRIVLVDDIDGSDADETVEFSVDGVTYEIDLSSENAKGLREAFEPFKTAGRRVTASRKGGRPTKRTVLPASPREIRDWARSQGIEVSDRGAIPTDVRKAFENR